MKIKTREIIEKILAEDSLARESDKWLTYKVLQEIANLNGEKIFIPFNIWDKLPSFETIRRERATIQNKEKRFLPNGETLPIVTAGEESGFYGSIKEVIVEPNTKLKNSHLI